MYKNTLEKAETMTKEQIDNIIKSKNEEGKNSDKDIMGDIIGMMIYSGKDTTCPACPKFIKVLSKDNTLINKIKALMKEG